MQILMHIPQTVVKVPFALKIAYNQTKLWVCDTDCLLNLTD